MRRAICFSIGICLLLIVKGQDKGIRFVRGLTWEEVKLRAKAEKKYIFLDIFTTWCGPCKQMDQGVYVDDSVGLFFNAKFISIKVQMDQTAKDDEFVKRWYHTSEDIGIKFKITAYPSYLFFSPDGTLVNEATGLKSVRDFLAEGRKAVAPGRKYRNPYAEYDLLLDNYRNGKKKFEKIPYMVELARKLNNTRLVDSL